MRVFGGCPNRTWRVTMDTGVPIIARLRWPCRWSTPQTVSEDTAGVAAVVEKVAFSIIERSTLWHPVRAGVPPTGLGRLRSSFRFCTEMRLARFLTMAGFSGRSDTAAWRRPPHPWHSPSELLRAVIVSRLPGRAAASRGCAVLSVALNLGGTDRRRSPATRGASDRCTRSRRR